MAGNFLIYERPGAKLRPGLISGQECTSGVLNLKAKRWDEE